jgi:hypothetical protein
MNARIKCSCGAELQVADDPECVIMSTAMEYKTKEENLLEQFRADHQKCRDLVQTALDTVTRS